MASVRKRGKTYHIAVSCGYDAEGKQIRRTMTFKPEPNMTEKQVQKELQRQTVLFEERCRNTFRAPNSGSRPWFTSGTTGCLRSALSRCSVT